MQCLLLTGGFGTRMKEIAAGKPKALLPIGSHPFLHYQLSWLKKLGVTEVVLLLGSGSDQIQSFLRQTPRGADYPRLTISLDGEVPLGTGGAILNARSQLQENFLVTYGDTFLRLSLTKFMKSHISSGKGVTFSACVNSNPLHPNNLVIRDGVITTYQKNCPDPECRYIDYGMLAFRKDSFFAYAPENARAFDLSVILSKAAQARDAGLYEVDHLFFEVGSPQGYEEFSQFAASVGYDFSGELKKLS